MPYEGELVQKQVEDRTVYGILHMDGQGKYRVYVWQDQNYEVPPDTRIVPTTMSGEFSDGWVQVPREHFMNIREKVLRLFEDAPPDYNICGMGDDSTLEYYSIKDHWRTETFRQVYEAIRADFNRFGERKFEDQRIQYDAEVNMKRTTIIRAFNEKEAHDKASDYFREQFPRQVRPDEVKVTKTTESA